MKSVFLRGRYIIFGASLVIAFLYSLYRIGPPPVVGYDLAKNGAGIQDTVIRNNLQEYLKSRYGLRIGPAGVVLAPRFGIPEDYGYSVIAWFAGGAQGEKGSDLFSVNAFMSQRGIPLSVDRPVNVSRTPDADEFILDAEESRVLFWSKQSDDRTVVTMLGFNESGELTSVDHQDTLLHKVDALQRFGQWRLPWRVELRTQPGAKLESARLFDERIIGMVDGETFEYELRTGRVHSNVSLELVQGSVGEADLWRTGRDVLRASLLFGDGRMNTFLDTYEGLYRWMNLSLGKRKQQSLLPPHLPQSLMPRDENWPPRIPHSDSSDLEWGNHSLCADADCPIVSLNAPNPERLGGVEVVAFDSRRLGVQYMAGRKFPQSTTGLVGGGEFSGFVKENTLLALPVTSRSAKAKLGAISMNRILVPPVAGRPTLLMGDYGEVAFGIWTDESVDAKWTSLWQGQDAIVEGGIVVQAPIQKLHGNLSRNPETEVFRSAIGMSIEGHILYAYGDLISNETLAKAMVQAGAVFAVPVLDHKPDSMMLGSGRRWKGGVVTDPDSVADQPSDALEYLWVYRADRLPKFVTNRGSDWDDQSGWFQRFYSAGCYDLVSHVNLSGKDLNGGSDVDVYAVDSLQVRAHLLPGLAEKRPLDSERLGSLRLPSDPLFSINVGLRNARSPYGMIFERRVWRQPKRGVLSLVADGRGTVQFGTYGSLAVPDSVRWSTLIQGPSLIEKGRPLIPLDTPASNVPVVAVGMVRSVAYFLVSKNGDRASLIQAATHLGVEDLMTLGERGSTETGLFDRFYAQSGKLFVLKDEFENVEAHLPKRRFDTSILFTGRVAPPQARMFSGRAEP